MNHLKSLPALLRRCYLASWSHFMKKHTKPPGPVFKTIRLAELPETLLNEATILGQKKFAFRSRHAPGFGKAEKSESDDRG